MLAERLMEPGEESKRSFWPERERFRLTRMVTFLRSQDDIFGVIAQVGADQLKVLGGNGAYWQEQGRPVELSKRLRTCPTLEASRLALGTFGRAIRCRRCFKLSKDFSGLDSVQSV